MTKNNFKFFLKKPSELAESSELPASGLAKHPCITFLSLLSNLHELFFEAQLELVLIYLGKTVIDSVNGVAEVKLRNIVFHCQFHSKSVSSSS